LHRTGRWTRIRGHTVVSRMFCLLSHIAIPKLLLFTHAARAALRTQFPNRPVNTVYSHADSIDIFGWFESRPSPTWRPSKGSQQVDITAFHYLLKLLHHQPLPSAISLPKPPVQQPPQSILHLPPRFSPRASTTQPSVIQRAQLDQPPRRPPRIAPPHAEFVPAPHVA
jgi:hypothetical protein